MTSITTPFTNITGFTDWQVATVFLSMAAFAGAVSVYLISEALRLKELEHTAKKEMLESAANVVAAFAIIAIGIAIEPYVFSFMINTGIATNTIPASFTLPPPPTVVSPGDLAAAVTSKISSCITQYLPTIYLLYNLNIILSQPAVFVRDTPVGSDADLLLSITENLYNMVLQIVILIAIWTKLLIIGGIIGPLLIAIGFPLRAFPPTRGGGAYLIAMGFALYFVMPTAYMMGVSIFFTGFGSCNPMISNNLFQNINAGNDPNALYLLISSLMHIFSHITQFLTNLNNFAIDLVKNFCLIPIFALAITLTFVNIGSTFLGARLSEIGRGLVKLI